MKTEIKKKTDISITRHNHPNESMTCDVCVVDVSIATEIDNALLYLLFSITRSSLMPVQAAEHWTNACHIIRHIICCGHCIPTDLDNAPKQLNQLEFKFSPERNLKLLN